MSSSSATWRCGAHALAPLVKIIREQWGLRHGFFTTAHAYTNSQSLTDQPMADRRDSWAAAENIIPSSSGAAKALTFIWPDLTVTGKAYRVPVRTGSIVELNAVVERPTSREEVRAAFRASSASRHCQPHRAAAAPGPPAFFVVAPGSGDARETRLPPLM